MSDLRTFLLSGFEQVRRMFGLVRLRESAMQTPQVALLIETSRSYGRGMLRGIVRYARLHGPWSFYLTPGDFQQVLPKMRQWSGSGAIARIETPAVSRAILAANVPTIALDLADNQRAANNPLSQLSQVESDSQGAARIAAEHLLERGFHQFAFVGIEGRVWSDRRKDGFRSLLRKAGFACHVYQPPRRRQDRQWDRAQAHLAQWLEQLPKPVGLMACDDDRGREVLEACRLANVQVPEEVAVIGVDNDELLCELADPPLSSVAMNTQQGGYRTASLLDQLMRRRIRKPKRLMVEALHVVTRRSTDIIAIEDRCVAAALNFIHQQAGHPLQIDDVVRHVAVSRRALEIRFRATLGRTILSEIQRIRLQRAKRLLAESDLPLPVVAESAGFGTPSYMVQIFRDRVGMTPAKYRRQVRTGPLDQQATATRRT
jgi:LacI family transcriptional regulator